MNVKHIIQASDIKSLLHRINSVAFLRRNVEMREKEMRRCFLELLASGHVEVKPLVATCGRKLLGDQQAVVCLN